MSVETAIDNLISSLKSLSSSNRSGAYQLISQAQSALESTQIPRLTEVEFNPEVTAPDRVRIPKPPSLREIPVFTPPESSELQSIARINERAPTIKPSTALPDPVNLLLPSPITQAPRAVQLRNPTVQVKFTESSSSIDTPRLTRPDPIQVEALQGKPPEVPKPEFAEFETDFYEQYQSGLQLGASDLKEISQWLRTEYASRIAPLDATFASLLRQVLDGQQAAVPAGWQAGMTQQATQEIRQARYMQLQEWDQTPSSITGLPTGARHHARAMLEAKATEETLKAIAQVSRQRREREVQHWQWAATLAVRWIEAALMLKAQEAGWRMQAHQIALDGAEGTLNVLMQVLDDKRKEFGLFQRYNETQIRRSELQMQLEKTKLDALNATLESNRLITAHNQNQIELYQTAISLVQTRLKLFQAQVEYLVNQKQAEKDKLALFEAEVKKFKADVRLVSADQEVFKARIKNDLSRLEYGLTRVRQYQAEVKGYAAEVSALATEVSAKSAENTSRMKKYQAELDAFLTRLRLFDDAARINLQSAIQRYNAEEMEAVLNVQLQSLENDKILEEALREMQYQQTDILVRLKGAQIQLAQAAAEGKVMTQGAQTLGGVAQAAFAGLNAVAVQNLVEEA